MSSRKKFELQFPTDKVRQRQQRLIGNDENTDEDMDGDTKLAEGADDEEEPLVVVDDLQECTPCVDGKIRPDYLVSLKKLQIAAAIIIGIMWLATLIIVLVKRFCSTPTALIGDTSTVFRTWGGADPQFLGTFIFNPVLHVRSNLEIVIPAILFGFLPALIHFILAITPNKRPTRDENRSAFRWYAEYVLNNRISPLRWVTYSWSYTMIAWIVMMFSGVTDVVALGVLLALKLGVYASMWIFEAYNQNRSRKDTRWESFFMAMFLFAVYWIAVFVHFVVEILAPPSLSITPWYFWAFVLGSAFFCITGGIIILAHFRSRYTEKNNFAYEVWITIHEILAMVFFSLVIIVATFMAPPF